MSSLVLGLSLLYHLDLGVRVVPLFEPVPHFKPVLLFEPVPLFESVRFNLLSLQSLVNWTPRYTPRYEAVKTDRRLRVAWSSDKIGVALGGILTLTIARQTVSENPLRMDF